jgi:hypothetical protein
MYIVVIFRQIVKPRLQTSIQYNTCNFLSYTIKATDQTYFSIANFASAVLCTTTEQLTQYQCSFRAYRREDDKRGMYF